MRIAIVLFFLSACARAPLSAEERRGLDRIAAVSFFGSAFTADLGARPLIGSRELVIDGAAWKVDEGFQALFQKALAARGKKFEPLQLDSVAVQKALGVRESRWKKVEGKQSRALLDLLFEAADRQGIEYFFLLTPQAEHGNFLTFRGAMGTACTHEGLPSRAFVYFFADFTLWNVHSRQKVYETSVDPSLTIDSSYADCVTAGGLADPVHALEDPVKRTMDHLVNGLFARLGW
jgi:hypothetical protein